jgi:hypothetical protein
MLISYLTSPGVHVWKVDSAVEGTSNEVLS